MHTYTNFDWRHSNKIFEVQRVHSKGICTVHIISSRTCEFGLQKCGASSEKISEIETPFGKRILIKKRKIKEMEII